MRIPVNIKPFIMDDHEPMFSKGVKPPLRTIMIHGSAFKPSLNILHIGGVNSGLTFHGVFIVSNWLNVAPIHTNYNFEISIPILHVNIRIYLTGQWFKSNG